MDDTQVFGDIDHEAVIGTQKDAINLEDPLNDLSGHHERPYLFAFAVLSDHEAGKSVARKAIQKFKTFNQILKEPAELTK